MSNQFKPLNQLTKAEIQELMNACISFDAGNILGSGYKESEVSFYSTPKFGWEWKNKVEFTNEIKAITSTGSIAAANKILEKQLTKAPEQPSATRLGKEELKTLEEQAEAREEAQAVAKEKGERRAREFVEQRQKIAEKLKNKAVYAKVEVPQPEKLIENKQKAYEEYKNAIKAAPDKIKVVNDLAEEIKTRVTPSLAEQGATLEEIEILSKQTAATLVEKMVEEDLPTYTPITTQAAVLSAVANDTKTVTKVVTDKAAEQVVHTAANNVGVFKIYPDQVARNITSLAFGEGFTETIFGASPNKIKVELSDMPTPGFIQKIDFGQLNQVHTELQDNQSQALVLIKEVGANQAKGILLKQTGTFLEKKIASLPTQSIAGKILSTPEAQSLFFSTFKVGTAVKWEATNWVGGLALRFAPESAPILSTFGKLTGINLIKPAAATVTKAITTAGAKVGAKAAVGVAAKTGVKAAISALGLPGGPVGVFLAWLGTEVIGKLLSKAGSWLKKFVTEHKEDIAIAGLALFGFGVIARSITLMISGGAFMLPIFMGGAAVTALGSRFLFLSGAFARAAVITIGKPILVTLLVFPVVVALILFIINSGAYLVPPSSSSFLFGHDNPYVSVTKVANPDKIDNIPQTVTYAITITALKSPLTNIKIVSTSCNVTKKDKSKVKCPIENIPDIPPGTSISPTSPYTLTFSADFGSDLFDSIVFDTVEISADTPEEKGIKTSGSETVCVGDCPTSCMKVVDSAQVWPGNLRANLEGSAAAISSGYPSYAAQVCGAGEVNLCFDPSRVPPGDCIEDIYARHIHESSCDVIFSGCGLNSSGDALFLLTHEVAHHVQEINSSSVSQYLQSGAKSELPICSYSGTVGDEYEGMAEAIGLYASIPSWGRCVTNYRNQYPKNYNFAKNFME